MVQTYWAIGKIIVEDEQQGEARAEYGKATLKELGKRLTIEFGKGFDVTNLRKRRWFSRSPCQYHGRILVAPTLMVETLPIRLLAKPSRCRVNQHTWRYCWLMPWWVPKSHVLKLEKTQAVWQATG